MPSLLIVSLDRERMNEQSHNSTRFWSLKEKLMSLLTVESRSESCADRDRTLVAGPVPNSSSREHDALLQLIGLALSMAIL